MYKHMPMPGQRVEIDRIGEGTVTRIAGDNEVEVAVSELETYRVNVDQLQDVES